MEDKKSKGQFYTVLSSYILKDFSLPKNNIKIIEPFSGKGDLTKWLKENNCKNEIIEYDIDPKRDGIIKRDTLINPPDYENSFVITNPPYLARNKAKDKTIFDQYNTNDLYKCFILSLCHLKEKKCLGGILIIPVGFFLSPREIDVKCRDEFLSNYNITKVKFFEEKVFPDTSTSVVAFSFNKSNVILKEQIIHWTFLPSNQSKDFILSSKNNWIIGGDIYNLPLSKNIKISRHVSGKKLKENEHQTFLTLTALDSGKKDGRICLTYKENYIYPSKETSRAYATLCITGRILTKEEQIILADNFNQFIESKRKEYWSLFLPNYRESKDYSRKRIPFDLAYNIINHLLSY